MRIEPLTTIDQIKKGDQLLISDGKEIIFVKALQIVKSAHDGTEVVFNLKQNKYFNVGMYLEGQSWVKEIFIVSQS